MGQKQKSILKKVLLVGLAILLVGTAAAGGYLYRDMQAQQAEQTANTQIDEMDAQISALQEKTQATETDVTTSGDTSACNPVQPNAATVDNIIASITTENTAALEGYMADTVTVVYAASDGAGERTQTQAVSDITSFISGANSWAFNIPVSTLATYAEGDYTQYFPATAVVGKSNQDKIISFNFDCNGKISTVFMTIDESIIL